MIEPIQVIGDALWFILPAYIANGTPVVLGGGPPIDGGKGLSDGYRIFDDVADTGKTLKVVSNHLESRVEGELNTCTIAFKPRSEIEPDYYVYKTDKWIVFPWEEAPVERKAKKGGQ